MSKLKPLPHVWSNLLPTFISIIFVVAIATRFGGIFSVPPSNITPIWVVDAILCAYLLSTNKQSWPLKLVAGFFGYLIGEFWIGYSTIQCFIYSAINTLGCACIVYTTSRFMNAQQIINSPHKIIIFILITLVVSLVVGTLGASTAVLTATGVEFLPVFQSWSISVFSGHILILPLLIAYSYHFKFLLQNKSKYLEAIALLLLLSASTLAIFQLSGDYSFVMLYLPTPFIIWATLRFGPIGATTGSILVIGIALFYTILGVGPFSSLGAVHDVTALQIFIVCLAVSFLMLSAAVTERDIATKKLRKATKKLQFTNNQLKDANREQSEFTYAISHDLKSPANTLGMLLNELKVNDQQLDSDSKEIIEHAKATVLRMKNLVESVLKYSKTVGSDMTWKEVDLTQTVKQTLNDLKYEIKVADAKIEVDSLPVIEGCSFQLGMLFQNLLSNAIKFNESKNQCLVKVDLLPSTNKNKVKIAINDNGIGIAAKYHDKIFGLFQRLHTQDAYSGSGIGLALCRRVVKNHNGDIKIESKENQGTTFIFTLNKKRVNFEEN